VIKIPTKIESIEQLKEKAVTGCDCFILLKGNLRSSKHIWYDKDSGHFEIFNMIDDTEQILNESELMDSDCTNIGLAIKNGVLYED